MTIMAIPGRALRVTLYLSAIFFVALSVGRPAAMRHETADDTPAVASLIELDGNDSTTKVRMLVVAGGPAQIGRQIGLQLRADIREAVTAALHTCAAEQDGWWSCQARVEGLRSGLSPVLHEELKGIAHGAGVSESDVLLLNSLSDQLFESEAGASGAAFAAWDTATVSGTALMGGVWNRNGGAEPLWIARRPDDGSATILLALPGWLGGMAGVNDSQVGAFALPIQTADVTAAGVPATISLREALAVSATPDEAIGHVVAGRHNAGAQVWFGSGQNDVQGVEYTSRLLRMLPADLDTYVSVGQYVHPTLVETQLLNADSDALVWQNERWRAMESVVRANVGWIGVEKSLSMLREMAGESGSMLLLMDLITETVWFGPVDSNEAHLLTFQPFDLIAEEAE